MTAPGVLLELLDGAAVGIFGILLSAAFCPIRWTGKKRWVLAGCTAGLLALQGVFYFGASPTAAQYLYPLITHLPLYLVLVLFSGQRVWPLVAVLTAYLCCQVRRWVALAVALFFPQHPLVQPVAELLFTLPLLLLFIRFLAPSMRQLSHYPASVQCQFGIVPLVSYLFDYVTHVYTSLLSEANPAAVEFMFFVCCAAFLCSILRASRVERQRIQMEQLQTSLNLQVTQAMREIEALRLSQQRASTYRHDLRHHMQFLAGCIENGRTEQALGYIRSVCSEIEAGKVTVYCENEAANLIFSAFADRAAKAGVQFTVQASRRATCACCSLTRWKTPCTPPCAAAKQGTRPLLRPSGTKRGKSCFCRSPIAACRTCSSGRASRSPTSPAMGLGCAASAPSQSGTAA